MLWKLRRLVSGSMLVALVGALTQPAQAAVGHLEQWPSAGRPDHPFLRDVPLPDDPDQALVSYHAESGSESATALRLLAIWGTDATTPVG